MTAKETLRFVLPPFLWIFFRFFKRRLLPSSEGLTYAPAGWATPLPERADSRENWDAFIASQRADLELLIAQFAAGKPMSANPVDLLRQLLFGYVFALTARLRPKISVLDYGSSLGEYYWLCRTLVAGVELEYHCKERPAVAEVGCRVTPGVIWHTDDSCLDRSYDLLVFSSSLQYLPDWRDVLRRAALSTNGYLLVSDMPVVRRVAAYVSVQQVQGVVMLYQPLNSAELVSVIEGAGLHLVHEFDMGPHPLIKNAPEQPVCAGWLFERRTTPAQLS